MARGPRKNLLHADSRRSPSESVFLRHSQHQRRGAAGRSRRAARALSEHRRPGRLRVQDPAAPDCGGRTGDARRTQRVWAIAGYRLGTRSSRRGVHVTRISSHPGSNLSHRRYVGSDRVGTRRASRRRHRGSGAAANVSSVYSGPRQARRASTVLSDRSRLRVDARSRSSSQHRDAGDPRARRHRSQ